MMYEIWIEEAGQEIHRQQLSEGQFHLGRAKHNEIYLPNPNVSRQHLRLDIGPEQVMITDLGSTNGTSLNGRDLVPHQPTRWPSDEAVNIGILQMWLRPVTEPGAAPPGDPGASMPQVGQTDKKAASRAASGLGSGGLVPSGLVPTVVSADATPQLTVVTTQGQYMGSDPDCAIRLRATSVASHHCLVQLRDNRVEIVNLDPIQPALLGGEPMPVGQPAAWSETQALQIGTATLYLTFSPPTTRLATLGSGSGAVANGGARRWRYALPLLLVGGLLVVCMSVLVLFAVQGTSCSILDPSCFLSALGAVSSSEGTRVAEGRATPTLAPRSSGPVAPTPAEIIEFATATPATVSAPVECEQGSSIASGWLDLPFPYQGTEPVYGGSADAFRRISQRSRFGGRLNAFFDHEYPVYPPAVGGREPETLAATLITFNGARSQDAYAQDSDESDWYSGHSGIDFAPATPREPTTPVLAAADGRLLSAGIDDDGNHLVRLEHDPDGDGRYQYATLYLHLHPDDYFFAVSEMEEKTPISAGQRIGTMGTTGRSSGIHLHFEVRHDVNGDGRFSIFERVDPYGFFPSQETPSDPWSQLISWVDFRGEAYEHEGITSDYLWLHPLLEVVDSSGECSQISGEQVGLNLYPVLGFGVVNPGFTYIARNEQGDVLREGPPHVRTITSLPENLEGINIESVSLELLDPVLGVPITINEGKEFTQNASGAYVFSAVIRKTGRYVLVGKEESDRVPPVTLIKLDGDRVAGEEGTYQDSVLVTLDPIDRGLITSSIKEVQYSLDCGLSWQLYAEPFPVTLATPHTCGEAGTGSQGIELGESDFILLVMSEDSENNIEQPPAQARFRLE